MLMCKFRNIPLYFIFITASKSTKHCLDWIPEFEFCEQSGGCQWTVNDQMTNGMSQLITRER